MDQKEALEELEKVKFYCKKMMQAYSIRVSCMQQRHELLKLAGSDFSKLPNDSKFYSKLASLVSKEYRLLRIVDGVDLAAGSNLALVVKELDKFKHDFGRGIFLQTTVAISNNKIYGNEVYDFLSEMTNFLEEVPKQIHKIKLRLYEEGIFLASKKNHFWQNQQDAEQFNRFILAWNEEIEANQKLVKMADSILKRNAHLVKLAYDKESRGVGSNMMVGGLLSSIGGGTATAAVAGATLGSSAAGLGLLFGACAGSLPLLIGFALFASGCVHGKKELFDLNEDKETLEMVKSIRKIKIPLFRRLFGN